MGIFTAIKAIKTITGATTNISSTVGDLINRGQERRHGNVEKRESRKHELDVIDKKYRQKLSSKVLYFLAAFPFVWLLWLYFFSPLLAQFSWGNELLTDYEQIMKVVGIGNVMLIVMTLLGVDKAVGGAKELTKAKLFTKELENKKEIEIEKVKKGVLGDDFVTLKIKPSAPDNVKRFYKRFKTKVIDLERERDLCAVGVIAHAGLECGWGEKILKARDTDTHEMISTNNIFNIKKSGTWTGKVAYRDVWEDHNRDGKYDKGRETEKAYFKVYKNMSDSFDDYADLLTSNERYKNVLAATNAYDYGKALYDGGYMTDGRAPEKIKWIADEWFEYET